MADDNSLRYGSGRHMQVAPCYPRSFYTAASPWMGRQNVPRANHQVDGHAGAPLAQMRSTGGRIALKDGWRGRRRPMRGQQSYASVLVGKRMLSGSVDGLGSTSHSMTRYAGPPVRYGSTPVQREYSWGRYKNSSAQHGYPPVEYAYSPTHDGYRPVHHDYQPTHCDYSQTRPIFPAIQDTERKVPGSLATPKYIIKLPSTSQHRPHLSWVTTPPPSPPLFKQNDGKKKIQNVSTNSSHPPPSQRKGICTPPRNQTPNNPYPLHPPGIPWTQANANFTDETRRRFYAPGGKDKHALFDIPAHKEFYTWLMTGTLALGFQCAIFPPQAFEHPLPVEQGECKEKKSMEHRAMERSLLALMEDDTCKRRNMGYVREQKPNGWVSWKVRS
jgi:hypothetical protein